MLSGTRKFSSSYRRPGRVILRVTGGPDRGKQVCLELADSRIRGGRSEINELALNDEHVSGSHFELRLSSRGVLLRDLDSTNGVLIGGLRVREVWIEPNATFRVGESTIQLVAADEIEIILAPTDRFEELVGQSHAMRELFAILERLATKGDELRVMIGGETGTGKEVVARGLHQRSPRCKGPFIVRDCATIPRELAESTLFGHSKGAFTGATMDRQGCFEEASGGTLFLDEIGELSPELQAKLLRVLQEKTVTRVGEHHPRPVDVRVLCATHRDLRKMVAEERFRQDLYFRLADFRVHMPSLRERDEDILVLADLFLQRRCEQTAVVRKFGAEAYGALRTHSWPGNVRELKSVVDRAHIMADGETIMAADLSLAPEDAERRSSVNEDFLLLNHHDAVSAFERHYFTYLLAQHPTRTKAALAAGMTTEGLRLALKRLQVSLPLAR